MHAAAFPGHVLDTRVHYCCFLFEEITKRPRELLTLRARGRPQKLINGGRGSRTSPGRKQAVCRGGNTGAFIHMVHTSSAFCFLRALGERVCLSQFIDIILVAHFNFLRASYIQHNTYHNHRKDKCTTQHTRARRLHYRFSGQQSETTLSKDGKTPVRGKPRSYHGASVEALTDMSTPHSSRAPVR